MIFTVNYTSPLIPKITKYQSAITKISTTKTSLKLTKILIILQNILIKSNIFTKKLYFFAHFKLKKRFYLK